MIIKSLKKQFFDKSLKNLLKFTKIYLKFII